ncbi:Cysteine--tRNA ligase [Zhongshania aliphaticivorans]|uniref:Cysteine--tRNA ligase n=1 Tax=Zhongshania aliphaticivorans TaxID=1470434 RepID=A0A5S9P1N3_9GAMM|nr:cysteine--tRNA ligase [Zhongshania aliphaticivorans]CAA0089924.1 Cysteine--tRNA ligase [Zhongshania aliphaticivorans]CAA0097057.1 Cysteine--tRNA ligase [Zhongshania aliphaticivorans]
MTIQIYNTLSRSKQPLVPLLDGKINMYVCGMTVYDYCHLGHARVLVAFDVITRYLRAKGFDVNYVRNITDIDDKILRRAEENDEPYEVLTERFIQAMHEDAARLDIMPPDQEPRATAHIGDILAMIGQLLEKGFAYKASNGDVYYRVTAFADYGKLSGKKPDELLSGARIAVDEAKEDPRDFALWKAVADGGVSWPSPWGDGRPGWHIECSAMSTCCLGDTFDIHGGGPDLVFPHHENEIAQSEAATGKQYAQTWMHAGAVRVDNEKMSKSLGNFFTIREILDKYHPEVVRYFLISSHYRSAINYSEDNLQIAKQNLERFYHAFKGLDVGEVIPYQSLDRSDDYVQRFDAAMADDFNAPVALAVLYDMVRELNSAREAGGDKLASLAITLKSLAATLGILQLSADAFLQAGSDDHLAAADIEALILERVQAKKDRLFSRADEIRDSLKDQGVILEDSREGTTWRRA